MKACKDCALVLSSKADICPRCKMPHLSDEWHGLAVIIDPEHSIIAKELAINAPGKYALKVR